MQIDKPDNSTTKYIIRLNDDDTTALTWISVVMVIFLALMV